MSCTQQTNTLTKNKERKILTKNKGYEGWQWRLRGTDIQVYSVKTILREDLDNTEPDSSKYLCVHSTL